MTICSASELLSVPVQAHGRALETLHNVGAFLPSGESHTRDDFRVTLFPYLLLGHNSEGL